MSSQRVLPTKFNSPYRLDFQYPQILCIDDDSEFMTALSLQLRQYQVDVLCADNGTDGIWLAINQRPDIIITDMRMPHGEGDYVVECLKGRGDTCDIPVVVLTGMRSAKAERWMLTMGVEGYLSKPARFDSLLNKLERHIVLRESASP